MNGMQSCLFLPLLLLVQHAGSLICGQRATQLWRNSCYLEAYSSIYKGSEIDHAKLFVAKRDNSSFPGYSLELITSLDDCACQAFLVTEGCDKELCQDCIGKEYDAIWTNINKTRLTGCNSFCWIFLSWKRGVNKGPGESYISEKPVRLENMTCPESKDVHPSLSTSLNFGIGTSPFTTSAKPGFSQSGKTTVLTSSRGQKSSGSLIRGHLGKTHLPTRFSTTGATAARAATTASATSRTPSSSSLSSSSQSSSLSPSPLAISAETTTKSVTAEQISRTRLPDGTSPAEGVANKYFLISVTVTVTVVVLALVVVTAVAYRCAQRQKPCTHLPAAEPSLSVWTLTSTGPEEDDDDSLLEAGALQWPSGLDSQSDDNSSCITIFPPRNKPHRTGSSVAAHVDEERMEQSHGQTAVPLHMPSQSVRRCESLPFSHHAQSQKLGDVLVQPSSQGRHAQPGALKPPDTPMSVHGYGGCGCQGFWSRKEAESWPRSRDGLERVSLVSGDCFSPPDDPQEMDHVPFPDLFQRLDSFNEDMLERHCDGTGQNAECYLECKCKQWVDGKF